MSDEKKNIDFWKNKIRNGSFRFTETRKAVLYTLIDKPGEYNIEEIHSLVRAKYPKIGIATVYRAMKLMEKIGLVSRNYDDENDRYNYSINERSSLKAYKDKEFKNIERHDFVIENSQKTILKSYSDILPFLGKDSNYGDLRDSGRIKTLERQMSIWLKDLNKLKREKEITLEDMIKDLTKIDGILKEHGNKRSNLIQILLDVQKECNWLPKHVLFYVSDKLKIPLTNVYNIASFYKFFNLEPRGKYSILVCMGTACYVRGSMNLLQRIVNVLGVKPGDTTSDLKFTLDTVNCLGACALGPVMMVGNKYYTNPSTRKLKKIFGKFD
jgi:NADH-quinone oxidoreductase subunit E